MNRRMKMKRLKQELKETKWELDLYKSHTQNPNVSYSKPEIRKISVSHVFDSFKVDILDEDCMADILKRELLNGIIPYIQIEKPDYCMPELGCVCRRASLTIVVPKEIVIKGDN